MTMPTGNGSALESDDLLLEGHEDRLQRVEQELGVCNRAVAVATVRLDTLSQQLMEANAAVLDRITSGFDSVHDRLGKGEAEAKSMAGALTVQRREVAELKAKSLGRAQLLKRLRNGGAALMLGAGGWFAGHFGDVAWKWISR